MSYPGVRTVACLSVAVLLMAAGAYGREVSRELKVSPDGTIEILNVSGSVRVVGWDRPAVSLTGDLTRDAADVALTRDGYRTSAEVIPAEGAAQAGAVDLTVRVPASSRVEVGTVSADVTVSDVTGAVFVYTVHGRTDVTGSPAEVETRSLKGDIHLAVTGSRVKVNTASGKATLSHVTGEADVSTVSGKVTVTGGQFGRGRFKTVSGELAFAAGLSVGGAFEFSTHSGNITLKVSESMPTDFDVWTRAGRLTNDVGPRVKSRPGPGKIRQGRRGRRRPPVDRMAPGIQPEQRRLSFSTGPGADSVAIGGETGAIGRRARVTVSSFNGDISLRRQ